MGTPPAFNPIGGWSGPHADRIGRVYAGMREVTRYGPGWKVERYIDRVGPPDERRSESATEEVLIYRGKKTLYRGTREDNAPVGLEWREIRVRSGMLIEENEAVQAIEFLDRPGNPTCESYGSGNTLTCSATKPVEPKHKLCTNTRAIFEDVEKAIVERFFEK
jgi:hypothetical protein